MARGLSNLQKSILMLAYKNVSKERREGECSWRPDLYAREVMASIFKLEANFYSWSEDEQHLRIDKPIRDRRGWVFEREKSWDTRYASGDVKAERYNVASASISRAFKSLEQRGLVKRQMRMGDSTAGIFLTPEGYNLIQSLLKLDFNG
jgi:hypothetical protein